MTDPTAIRLYSKSVDLNSGYGSREGWFVLRVDMATDPDRQVPGPGKQGLDWVLAHELDHVMVNSGPGIDTDGHIMGEKYNTQNSKLCSGLGG
jgi:hypothetical protein